jgi:transcriptional regulator with XRE-family HTH domain
MTLISTGADRAYLAELAAHPRHLRRSGGLTQQQVADRAGLDRTFIGFIERGRCGFNVVLLNRLAGALGVSDPKELLP